MSIPTPSAKATKLSKLSAALSFVTSPRSLAARSLSLSIVILSLQYVRVFLFHLIQVVQNLEKVKTSKCSLQYTYPFPRVRWPHQDRLLHHRSARRRRHPAAPRAPAHTSPDPTRSWPAAGRLPPRRDSGLRSHRGQTHQRCGTQSPRSCSTSPCPTSSTTEEAGPAALPDSLRHSASSSRPSEHPPVPIHDPPVDHDSISVLDQNEQPTSPSASHPVTPLTPTLHPKGRLKYPSVVKTFRRST